VIPAALDTTVADHVLLNLYSPKTLSLEDRIQLTQALSRITPVIEACGTDDETVIQRIELLTGQSVGMISHGPSAENVQILKSFPT
jgi:hypothetical protein